MKNYLKSLVASGRAFSGCGGSGRVPHFLRRILRQVAGKIENRDSLSQKDYEMMFEYVDEAMDAVDRVSEKYKNDPVRLQTEMNAVNEKYGRTSRGFRQCHHGC